MLLQYSFKTDVPDYEVEPITHNVATLPFEGFRLKMLFVNAFYLTSRYRLALRPILF